MSRKQRVNRRMFLKSAAQVAGAACLVQMGGIRCLLADDEVGHKPTTIVFIDNLGAMDALAALQPHRGSQLARTNDNYLSAVRTPLMSPVDKLLKLDSTGDIPYALHPQLKGLKSLWNRNNLAIVMNAGFPLGEPDTNGLRQNPNVRSHFDQMNMMQLGTTALSSVQGGMLNRLIGHLAPRKGSEEFSFEALSLQAATPTALSGPHRVASINGLSSLNLGDSAYRESFGPSSNLMAGLANLYSTSGTKLLKGALTSLGVRTTQMIEDGQALRRAESDVTVTYSNTRFQKNLRQAADVIINGDGRVRVIHIPGLEGLDTHNLQVPAVTDLATRNGYHAEPSLRGSLENTLADFGDGLQAFCDDLRANQALGRVLIVAFSEFSRTVTMNGNFGTDHCRSTVMWLAGGARINPKRFLSEMAHIRDQNLATAFADPSVGADARTRGSDLYVTYDYRRVMAEVFARHLGVTDATVMADLLPGLTDPMSGFYNITV